MRTVIKNDYSPQIGDYCETIVVDRESEKAYIFDCDGVWTELPQPIDIEKFLKEAKNYTDEVAETKVDKVEGKELSSNDFTDELKDKLDSIAYGAQENVIESIKVNGKGVAVIDKAVNINVPTKVSQLENDEGYINDLSDYYTEEQVDELIGSEANVREIMDESLQEQIDAIAASSDVIDIVGTKAALDAYDKSKVHDNDIIKVLNDETRDHATTYYRFNVSTQTWSYVGAEGPFYTKAEADGTFVPLTRTVNGKALSSNITLNAGDVGAATTGALAAEAATRKADDEALQTQIDEATGAIEELDASKADKSEIPTTVAQLTDSANYVKFTDYATDSKSGVIKTSAARGTYMSADNQISAGTKTYAQYKSAHDALFIGKGTLENVLTGKELQSKSDVENLISGKADKSEIKDPADYYWANVKVSDSSKTNTAPEFAQIKTTGGNFPHIKGNGTNLTLSPDAWTQGKGGVVIEDAAFRPSNYKNKGMSLGKASTSLWSDLYMNGSIYKDTYQQQLQDKAGTIALTSDIPTNVSSFTNDAGYLTNSALANYYTKDETYTQQEVNSLINSYSIPKASATTLGGIKVGNNLSIDANGVLSADAQSITVDSALSTTSTNPAQNKVITEAINGKNKTIYTAENLAPTADTTAAWITLLGGNGVYVTAYSQVSKFAYQPAQYGFLISYVYKNDIRQEFYKQNDGVTFLRSGNASGWAVIDGGAAGEFRRLGSTVDKTLSTTSYNPVRNSVVTTKINEIDRFYSSLRGDGTTIAANSDLNTIDFLKINRYHSGGNSTVATYSNCPTTVAFKMEVMCPYSKDYDDETTSTWVERIRKITDLHGDIFIQKCNSNGEKVWTYGSWKRYANTGDIGNGTLTIQKNGTNVDTFTANATSNKTVNITVPTKTSDLTNDSGFVTDVSGLVKKSGDTMTGNLGIKQAGATDVYLSMGASNRTDTQLRSSNAGNTLLGNSNTSATGVFIRPQGVGLGTNETVFYKDGTINVSNKITNLTAGTADKDAVNYSQIKNLATVAQATYTAGDHISIENNVVTAEDYVHSENPLASISPTNTLAGSNITNNSIAFDKTVPGDFLKLQLTTVDPGEGSPLAANTILGVYQ